MNKSVIRMTGAAIVCIFGVSCASATPSPTVSLEPASSATLPPTATPDPQPTLGPWVFSGDTVPGSAGCADGLSPNGFVLGTRSADCAPGVKGRAEADIAMPAVGGPQVLVISLDCPQGSCSQSVKTLSDGRLSVSVDGVEQWSAGCTAGSCNPLALDPGPTLAIVTQGGGTHHLVIETQGQVRWTLDRVQVEHRSLPTLIQGMAYSPYRDCQSPNVAKGSFPTKAQVEEDMQHVRNMGNAIRTYSATGIEAKIPAIAHRAGLRVIAGAWLGKDLDVNEQQIAGIIQLAGSGDVESVIVGNEVLLRGDLTEDQLLTYIKRVKDAVHVPVTYADIASTLADHPAVMQAVDYEMVHIYPYWNQTPIEQGAQSVADIYHHIQQVSGKRVVIGETGWPTDGPANGGAVPSPKNARRFLHEFLALAQAQQVEFFYFGTYDEMWKTEAGVGAYWGIMTHDRVNKFDLASVLVPLADSSGSGQPVTPGAEIAAAPALTGTPGSGSQAAALPTSLPPTQGKKVDLPMYVYLNFGAIENHFAPSGFMGDLQSIGLDYCYHLPEDKWNKTVIEVRYTPAPSDPLGWSGVYWQDPENNWGDLIGGFDVSEATTLTFRARSAVDGTQIKFFAGGINKGPYPSSIAQPVYVQGAGADHFITLTTQWQTLSIDLSRVPLTHVIDGLGWSAEHWRNPNGAVFYLDSIVFSKP